MDSGDRHLDSSHTTKSPSSSGNPLGGGLRTKIASASLWAGGTTLTNQLTRFVSNLILSRLLFPEAFGLMALINSVLQGLQMFSDFGIGPAIIQAREHHPRMLDVAWSLHVVRGWILFGVVLLITYPAALWYNEPELNSLLPAMGLICVIRGYSSTSQFTLARDLKLRELFYVEIGSQVVTFVVSAVVAMLWHSVWALIFGGWAGALAFSVLTYTVDPSRKHQWCWDKEALSRIAKFGRWVMMSTILTYVLVHGDRLILGSFISFAQLGLYQIALVIARAASQLANALATRVLFPVYAEIGRETTPELLRRIRKIRFAMMALLLPPAWILTCYGDLVVILLWDPRYHGAGWMVQALSVGGVFTAFGVGPLSLARGEPWIGLAQGVFHAAVLFPTMWICHALLGPDGLIVALAASPLMVYLFGIWMQLRYRIWMPGLDAAGIAVSAVAIGLGFMLRSWLGF